MRRLPSCSNEPSTRRAASAFCLAATALLLLAVTPVMEAATPTQPAVAAGFGKLPLAFEANRGQTDSAFQFLARGVHHTIYLGSAQSIIAVEQPDAFPARSGSLLERARERSVGARFLRFTLLGANANAASRGTGELAGRVNYLTGRDPTGWSRGVPVFRRVEYQAVYPGIDLVYYGNQAQIEYDFIVAPGADPARIAFQVEGADRMELDARGDLVLSVGLEKFRQQRPVAYQWVGGKKKEVPAEFRVTGRMVAFALGAHDPALPLIVDPILSYSTFLGGGKTDRAWAVAADAAGNAYVAGDTLSVFKRFPLSGTQTNFGGGTKYGGDVFVLKLDPTGTNFVYFTYLGSEDDLEAPNGLAVDPSGAVYVTGFTVSSNFPVFPTNSVFQPRISGERIPSFNTYNADLFVTKLDGAGQLVYSTYLGGELADVGAGIAVDASGSAYLTGFTQSSFSFQVTNEVRTLTCTNFFGTNQVCGTEKVTTNVTPARLLVPTSVFTNVVRIKTSKVEGVLITNQIVEEIITITLVDSRVLTTGFPIVGAAQTNGAGLADIFVAKLNPDASALVYSTYYGGFGTDFGTGIALDTNGNVVISGWTDEPFFPVLNAIQPDFGGGRDALAVKFDAAGNPVYATYLGGSLNDVAYRVALDAAGSAYVVGATGSRDFLGTPGVVRPGGVSKSVDAGANWVPSSAGLTHTGVRALAINPLGPSTLYAATPRGVFISTDAGGAWQPSNAGLSASDITAIAVDPTTPSIVYAGSAQGVHRSEDSGFGWTNILNIAVGREVRALIFDPTMTSTLYAGTRRGFLISTNSGNDWIAPAVGLKNQSIHALALHPAMSSLLFAATDGGIYKSTNGGFNWKAFNTGLAHRKTLSLAINPSTPEVLLAGTVRGIYRTVNSGTNWTAVTNGIGRAQTTALQFDPGDSLVVYAATTNGLFKSTNGGLDWANSSAGLPTRDLASLAIDPTNPSLIYAGARGTNFSGGTNDAFLVKLAPDGLSLEYAFTFGGNRTDEGRAVAVDTNGSAFVTGVTLSRDFPVNGAMTEWQGTNNGKADAFVAQFDPTGSSNVLSILLGGRRNDFGHGIALGPFGGIFVVGASESKDFPLTNSVQLKHSADKTDAFITRLELVPVATNALSEVETAMPSAAGVTQPARSPPARRRR